MRRERDRHQPQLPLEIGDIERDAGRPVAVQPDDAGEQRDDPAALVRQPGDRAFRKAVAATTEHPDGVRPCIDQPSVEVAQFDDELALAIIIFLGRRAVEFSELEHRLVDRGEGDVGLLARGEPRHLDRNLDRAARPQDIGSGERRREGAGARIDP